MSKWLRYALSRVQLSAAEAVLGGVALVLVIWLLWPEASTTQLDQRTTWQQRLEETKAERQVALEARRPVLRAEIGAGPDTATTLKDDGFHQEPVGNESRRQRVALAKPSELADRHRSWDSEPVAVPVARGPVQNEEAMQNRASADGLAQPDARPPLQAVMIDPDRVSSLQTENRDDLPLPSEPGIDVSEGQRDDQLVTAHSSKAAVDEKGQHLTFDPVNAVPSAALAKPDEVAAGSDDFVVESSLSAHVRQRPRDDAPSWLRNAASASLIDDRPMIAVVIDDLGLNRANTKALNDLPGPLTLAFLPYAGRIEEQTTAAIRAGHELMVHLPMEPLGSAWPGPNALVTSLDRDEFVKRLEANLNRFQGYAGVNNHMGSRLTSDRGRMDLVMRQLRERDVLFLDSKTSSRSVASDMASRNGVPNTTRDVFLDHVIDIDKIRSQMALIEHIARQTGSAVAIGHPHKATLKALREWLPTLSARGFALAPISAVVARRACLEGLLITTKTCGRYLHAQRPVVGNILADDS